MQVKNVIRLICCTLMAVFLSCQSGTGQTELEPAEAKQKMEQQPDVMLLDVRTPEEFAEGRLQGAVNMDVQEDSFADKITMLDSSKTYIVYCRSGSRSHAAAKMISKNGFTVYVLKGGILAWMEKKYPVVKD